MSATQRAHFRKVLEALKGELSQDIDRTVQAMQEEATVFADPNDRATQESDMSLELRNRDRERKLIRKIDETLQRIEKDDYGYCEKCGIEIGLKRLEARPTATLCIDCKTLDEQRVTTQSGSRRTKKGADAPFLLRHRTVQCCAAASAFTAFMLRRTRPFSSASSTLTFTCWPSFR
jgi:DnaK suppressor protein